MGFFSKISRGKENESLWADFAGLANDSDLLTKKAKILAAFLIQSALSDQRLLKSKLEEISAEKDVAPDFRERVNSISSRAWNNAFYEILFLLLHFSDRVAFQYLKPEKRNLFIDALFSETLSILSTGPSTGIEYIPFATEHMLMEAYNDRQRHYSTFKELVPGEDESFAGTVFWEFGKAISKILTGEARDIRIVAPAQVIVTSRVFAMELPQLLTGAEVKR